MCCLILLMNLMCFAELLEFFIVDFLFHFDSTASFCSCLILMSKRMRLIRSGDSNSKHFSFFVFYFYVSNNKISTTPPPAIKFSRIFQPPCLFQHPVLIKFWRIFQPPVYSNPTSIRYTKVQGMELYKKRSTKRLKQTGNLFRKYLQIKSV